MYGNPGCRRSFSVEKVKCWDSLDEQAENNDDKDDTRAYGASGGKVIIDRETKIGYSPETPYFHPFLTAMRYAVLFEAAEAGQADS